MKTNTNMKTTLVNTNKEQVNFKIVTQMSAMWLHSTFPLFPIPTHSSLMCCMTTSRLLPCFGTNMRSFCFLQVISKLQ